jgi:hypothetical protein
MANALKKNVYYVDTVGTITADRHQPCIRGVMVTPSGPNASVAIKESVSGVVIFSVVIDDEESHYFTFDALAEKGILVTNSFEVSDLTNIICVHLYGDFKKVSNEPG